LFLAGIGIGLLAVPQSVLAQRDIVAVSWNTTNSPVSLLDRTTGDRQVVGSSGFQRLNSLARDPGGTLFSVAGNNQLVTINPNSGAGTGGPLLSVVDVRALAFSPAGQLFAIQDGGTGASDRLFTIDTNTGTGTLIGAMRYAGVQGLEFFSDGTLYGWEVGSGTGSGAGLIRIDPSTGAATDIDPFTDGSSQIQSLAFGEGTALYGAGDGLYAIDILNGAAILIGQRQFADIRGIAVVPEPAVMTLLVSGMLAAAMVFRRRQQLPKRSKRPLSRLASNA
jgi:WD40 repeat protein